MSQEQHAMKNKNMELPSTASVANVCKRYAMESAIARALMLYGSSPKSGGILIYFKIILSQY